MLAPRPHRLALDTRPPSRGIHQRAGPLPASLGWRSPGRSRPPRV